MSYDIMRKINDLKFLFSEIVEFERIENGCFENETVSCSDLPNMCRIAIVSKPSKGSFINFELWLPDNWNGIFIGCGNGGMAGDIRYNDLIHYARLGYAVPIPIWEHQEAETAVLTIRMYGRILDGEQPIL